MTKQIEILKTYWKKTLYIATILFWTWIVISQILLALLLKGYKIQSPITYPLMSAIVETGR